MTEEAAKRYEEFDAELVKEIKYLNMELQSAINDDEVLECHPEWVERLIAALRIEIRVLAVFRGSLPFGPMEQAAYKDRKWKGVSYEDEVRKIVEEIGIPYPLYPEEEDTWKKSSETTTPKS